MNRIVKAGAVALALSLPQGSAAQDWTGFYAGLGVSRNTGEDEQVYDPPPYAIFDLSGNQVRGFLGYNLQNGNLVYGGELVYSGGEINYEGYPAGDYYVGDTFQVKGRLGYAAGNALWFGTLGWVSSETHYDGATNNPITANGHSFGVGVDFMIGEQMFVGGEIERRLTEFDMGSMGGFPLQGNKHQVDAFSLRLGFKF